MIITGSKQVTLLLQWHCIVLPQIVLSGYKSRKKSEASTSMAGSKQQAAGSYLPVYVLGGKVQAMCRQTHKE